MDFLNTLSEINKNKDNFKKWEEEQQNETVQREELQKRRKHTEAEIAQAKAFGEKIIDVVDIMDNHSESVAENVETATQPMVGLAPVISFFGSGYLAVQHIFKPNFNKRNELRDTIIKEHKGEQLTKQIQKQNSEFWLYDLVNEREIKKIKDTELRQKAQEVLKQYQKEIAPLNKKDKLGLLGMAASTLISFVGINIYAAKLQVDSSKIARFQAREFLKDPKTFVMYTPEQIKKAKEEIDKHPEWKKEEEKEILQTGFFSSIKNLFRDRKAYAESLKNDEDESKKVTRNLTQDEIENAKKDKEVIQRTVRIINNEAEKYAQRMEVAGDVIMGGTPILGALVGGATSWVLNKIGVIDKYVDNQVEQNGSDKTKKLYEDLKKGKESGKSTLKKWGRFMKSFQRDLGPQDKGITGFINSAKRFNISALATKTGRNFVMAGIGSVITGTVGAIIGLQLQKSAARAGRYTAKCEMEKDPKNFIGYTEDDYKEVKNIKSDKKSSDVKEILMFLPTVIKQYIAYKDYRSNEFKENQLLQKQLLKQEVSEQQLKDAKNLQRKVFNTFEKVDDNSQTYSEATEAAIDIAQPMVFYGGILTALSPVFVAGVQMYRGKLTGATVLNKVMGFLSASSERLNSNWFKKYINNVGENIQRRVQNTDVEAKPIGALLKDINLQEDPVFEIFSKSVKNIENLQQNFAKMSDEEQKSILMQMENFLNKSIEYRNAFKDDNEISEIISDEINTFFPTVKKKDSLTLMHDLVQKLQWRTTDTQARADLMDIIINPSSNLTGERLENAKKLAEKCNVNTDEIFSQFRTFRNLMSKTKLIDKILKENPNILKEATKDLKNIDIEKEFDSNKENIIQSIKMIESTITKDMGEKEAEEIRNNLNNLCKEIEKTKGIDLKYRIENIIKITEKLSNEAKIKDFKDFIPKEYLEPKTVLNTIKAEIEKLTDEEFAQKAEKLYFDSMTKEMMLKEIIPKLEKIMDNMPKEEFEKVMDKAVKEFNEHPDEFMQLLTSGKIYNILLTPGLEKAMAATGASWLGLNIVMTYAISSYLGEVQLEAGRLGVMKAIESLDDYRYYANIEPTDTPKNIIADKTNKSKKTETNLLEKYSH